MEGHSTEQLTQSLSIFFKENDFDIKDCHGQVMTMPATWVASIVAYKHKLKS